jgi:hypothetical protein
MTYPKAISSQVSGLRYQVSGIRYQPSLHEFVALEVDRLAE